MKWISRIFSRKKSLETTFDPEFHITGSQIDQIQREIHNAATFVKKERDTGGIEP